MELSFLPTLALATFVVLAVGYGISGLDDLVFDVVYWVRRTLFGRPFRPVPLTRLDALAERRFAIFVPAWHESAVIEEMMARHIQTIDYGAYDVFVGTYPNDPETQAAADRAAAASPRVHKCVCPDPGPTTKADNLNAMLAVMEQREAATGLRYDAVVLHDAEDLVHPYELKLVNLHLTLETADMIQTPILPVRVGLKAFTQGTYMDQFAECQTKDMHVRGWVGGFVPSCGVATTLSRAAIEALRASHPENLAFDPGSLTEDYEIGLKLRLAGLRGVFVRQQVDADRPVLGDREPERWVATRSEFPDRFSTSMRQRARWSLGIVFQGWQRNGWPGRLVDRWLLFHDRKAAWTYPLVLVGYVFLAALVAYSAVRTYLVPDLVPVHLLAQAPWIWWTLLGLAALMVNRLAQRAIAVGRIYGVAHAVVAVARQPWDNAINLGALFRAARQFRQSVRDGKAPAWDKTQHHVPEAVQPALAPLEITAPLPAPLRVTTRTTTGLSLVRVVSEAGLTSDLDVVAPSTVAPVRLDAPDPAPPAAPPA